MKNKLKWTVGLIEIGTMCSISAVKAQNMVGETVPQSQSVLDSYFVTNAIPGQLQYWEMIDTEFYYVSSIYASAQAAAASAQAAAASSGRVFASLYVEGGDSSTPMCNLLETNGISSNAFSTATVTFGASTYGVVYLTNYFSMPRAAVMPPIFLTATFLPWAGGIAMPVSPSGNQLSSDTFAQGVLITALTTNYFSLTITNVQGTSNYWMFQISQ